jgi:LysR family transcriptional regulator, transcriptional activator for dmlA
VHDDPSLRDLRLFCTLARRSSFVATATELGNSPAYVTKRIAILERSLRVKLFHRTTRRVSVTEDGERVYRWAQRILEDVDGMTEDVASGVTEPRGLLRISTSLRLGRNHVAPVLSLLMKRHPALEIWLELVDRRVDLVAENFHLDIRVGEVQEPHLIAHRIAESSRILCAAPSYLERRGHPKALADLAQHDCLLFREREEPFGVWRLHGPNGLNAVKVTGPMAANHTDIVLRWARDGHGIVMVSIWDVAESLASGTLVRILPAYRQPADVWAVSTARSTASAKVRVCIEFLREHLTRGAFSLVTTLGR